jgi:Leucine-rich repeat (LRR) protein
MKPLIIQLSLVLLFSGSAWAQNVKFLDPNFKKACIYAEVDLNGDGEIQVSEAQKVVKLYVDKRNIDNLTGIKSFTNLEEFGFYYNDIRNVDLSGLKKLRAVYGFSTKLESINLKGCTNVEGIYLSYNAIRQIDLTGLTKLKELEISNNQLFNLDISNMPLLENCKLQENELRTLDFKGSNNIKSLQLHKNNLTSLDARPLKNLELLWLWDNRELTSLKVMQLRKLEDLNAWDCPLTNLNMSGLVSLRKFNW